MIWRRRKKSSQCLSGPAAVTVKHRRFNFPFRGDRTASLSAWFPAERYRTVIKQFMEDATVLRHSTIIPFGFFFEGHGNWLRSWLVQVFQILVYYLKSEKTLLSIIGSNWVSPNYVNNMSGSLLELSLNLLSWRVAELVKKSPKKKGGVLKGAAR